MVGSIVCRLRVWARREARVGVGSARALVGHGVTVVKGGILQHRWGLERGRGDGVQRGVVEEGVFLTGGAGGGAVTSERLRVWVWRRLWRLGVEVHGGRVNQQQ